MTTIEEITTRLGEALNMDQMHKLLPDTHIIPYPELKRFKSLKELLGQHNRAVILYLLASNYGHWTLIMRRKDGVVECFDSLGKFVPDGELRIASEYSGNKPELLRLIASEKPMPKVAYNDVPIQKWSPSVKTCGRHVVARAQFPHLDEFQYVKMLKKQGVPDMVVCRIPSP